MPAIQSSSYSNSRYFNAESRIQTEPIRARIMVIDSDHATPALINKMLGLQECEILAFPIGESALMTARNYIPDLILLSDNMADVDGFELCRNLKILTGCRAVPLIFMTVKSDMNNKTKAFDAGADDVISKPFHFAELRNRISLHLRLSMHESRLELRETLEKQITEVSDAQLATIFALARLAEQRDEDTGAHLERVREYCKLLAEMLGMDSLYSSCVNPEFVECIMHAAPLHDVGKVAIPDSILLKPGKLSHEEFEIMKTHAIMGADNMQMVFNHYSGNSFVGMGIEIALYHHERWDGTGYPDRLIGKNIPLSARIVALADFYDALRSDRCYRKGLCHEVVKAMIKDESGKHFDPEIVRVFLDIESEFKRIDLMFSDDERESFAGI